MKISTLALLAILLIPFAVAAQPRAIVAESVIDVGRVIRGEKVQHRFEIRNEGDRTLTIREVEAACGCTVTEYDRTIAPGAVGSVLAVVDTEDFRGAIAKAVTVFTDDPKNPKFNLVVKAEIRSQVEARPGYARMIVVQGEAADSSRQWLWSSEGPALEVMGVESPYPFLIVESRRAAGDERQSQGAEVQWIVDIGVADDAPVGPFADHLRVRTSHPDQPIVKIPVSGFVRPLMTVRPRVAEFGRLELNESFSAVLEVENLGSAEVSVVGVTTNLSGTAAEVEELEAGKRYRVEVTLTPEMAKGPFEGKLQIETSSPRQPLVEVDLRGTVL